ncbi:hypothetical protein MAPG_04157 [Magnaporthiopsis poae ATCC 64411]|uniref:Uncharacterized protein n=1 Tax=Magnaporthiopsis poae (strain ATCC 64411 / 73-15) TaxID=644358 RepID=A0A0C4DVY9_MAGP6|nr:hypothetical protein MAPG_04157 [Magnaporthiopsis poae ATCC 64411]
MASVDTVLTVISAIKTVIELYEDLESGKKEVDDTERSLGSCYEVFKSIHATLELNRERGGDLGDVGKQLGKHIDKIGVHCDALKELLSSVRNRTSPDPTKFRHRYLKLHELNWMVWNWGPAGRARVQAEVAEIQREQTSIDNLLRAIGFSRSEAAAVDQKQIIDAIEGIRRGLNENRLAAPGASNGRVLFVDLWDEGRSVVSQGIMELLAHWTRACGKPFPVAEWGSAGFFVRAQGDCVGEIRSMSYLTKKFVFDFRDGGERTDSVACDALYDNKAFGRIPPDVKATAEARVRAYTSRGMRKGFWDHYDYICCFTYREYDNLMRLKRALAELDGREDEGPNASGPNRKGMIVHLGAYITKPTEPPKEIVKALDAKDPVERKGIWNAKVAELKRAVRGFLSQELNWVPPDPKNA